MRKKYTLISLIVGIAFVLAACAGADDDDNLGTPGAIDGTPSGFETPGGLDGTAVATDDTADTPEATLDTTPLATTDTATTPTIEATTTVTGTQGIPGTGAGDNVIEDFGLVCQNVVGLNVYSNDGEEVGEVEDVVVNTRSGRVMYAVIDADEGRILVPWGAVKIAAASTTAAGELNELQLSVNAQAFRGAPVIDDDNFLKDATDNWDTDLRGYWKDFVTETPDDTNNLGQGNVPASERNFGLICREFNEYDVVSNDGEEVGEADDFILDVNGNMVAYLVVETEDGDLALVPFKAVTVVKGDAELFEGQEFDFQLSVDAATFDAAPTFDDYDAFDAFDMDWDVDLDGYWDAHVTPANP